MSHRQQTEKQESEIQLKDFRLHLATRKAADEIKTTTPSRTVKEFNYKDFATIR
jgi:hypothetical protein